MFINPPTWQMLKSIQGTVPEMPDFCQPLLQRLEQTALMPHRIDQLTVNESLRSASGFQGEGWGGMVGW